MPAACGVGLGRCGIAGALCAGPSLERRDRIGDGTAAPYDRGLFSATELQFDAQVSFLAKECDIIDPDDLDVMRRRRGRHVLITFDDGYRDNYEKAFPILRRHNATATFFVTTGFIDGRRFAWWDEIAFMVRRSPGKSICTSQLPRVVFDEPDRGLAIRTVLARYKQLAGSDTARFMEEVSDATGIRRPDAGSGDVWMTWDMLRAMTTGGMRIGGHTATHPVLARLPIAAQLIEVAECARRLREELSQSMAYFSYPVGGLTAFDENTRLCLEEVGVKYAFSYYGGRVGAGPWHPHDIPRVPMETDVTSSFFRSLLTLPAVFA